MFQREVEISGRRIGRGNQCLIIAEAGVNHNGNPDLARMLVEAGASAGVDAVKFQTFSAERLATPFAKKADYQIKTTGSVQSQLEMLKKLELAEEVHKALLSRANELGILFLSTPFDEKSADFLDELGVSAFKISSGDLTNLPFLAYIARKKKPVILSTGMADMSEVEEAVQVLDENGNSELVLLHCLSNYPADSKEVNLRAMHALSRYFDVPVGFSDHTLGIEVALAAAALGACVIEKHFTLDKNSLGPDHASSLEPTELQHMIAGIRLVERALGDGEKLPSASELSIRVAARKSIVAACYIRAGTVLTETMVSMKRPGTGLLPKELPAVIGKKAVQDIAVNTLISWDLLS